MLCYLKELARLDHLGALDSRYCAFILGDGAISLREMRRRLDRKRRGIRRGR